MSETTFSLADLEAAERLMGIVYTERERQQMAGNLDGQIASAKQVRALGHDNSVPMASASASPST